MRADERQAAAAYAYAWWMTGDEDAASAALSAGLSSPDPPGADTSVRLIALMTAVRKTLGEATAMPASSEVALLHDGFDVPLEAAAALAGVQPDAAGFALVHGRLEALLETVRDPFLHAERLAGLAVGNADDVAHARSCSSCSRALTLIERGRAELREVSSVSAPPGMIARLVAQAAPPPEAEARPAAPESVEPAAPSVEELEAMLRAEAPVDQRPPVAIDEAPADEAPVEEAPAAAPPVQSPPVQAPPPQAPPTVTPAPEAPPRRPDQVPVTRRRKGVLTALAGAGLLTFGVLVAVIVNNDDLRQPPIGRGQSEQPAVAQTDLPEPSDQPTEKPTAGRAPFDPPEGKGFAVAEVGLLVGTDDEIAPSGVVVGPQEPLRVAVDYVNGSKGVELNAVWRVDDKVYERLRAVVSGRASRHVWGLPVPPDGWPRGRHSIAVTTKEGLAGSIDFTIRSSE